MTTTCTDCGRALVWGTGPLTPCSRCASPLCAACRRMALEPDALPPQYRTDRRCETVECRDLLCRRCSPSGLCRPCKDAVDQKKDPREAARERRRTSAAA